MDRLYKVSIASTAQSDLLQIFSYIAQDSLDAADRFTSELEAKILSLEAFPERQPLIPENNLMGTGYRHIVYKKYRIVYRIVDREVFVVRVIQGSKLLDL